MGAADILVPVVLGVAIGVTFLLLLGLICYANLRNRDDPEPDPNLPWYKRILSPKSAGDAYKENDRGRRYTVDGETGMIVPVIERRQRILDTEQGASLASLPKQ